MSGSLSAGIQLAFSSVWMAAAITINMNRIPAINSVSRKNGSKSNNEGNGKMTVNRNLTPAKDCREGRRKKQCRIAQPQERTVRVDVVGPDSTQLSTGSLDCMAFMRFTCPMNHRNI